MTAPLIGSALGGRYELTRHIACGGMGDVYEGRDRFLRRPVAVKLCRATPGSDRHRFDEEIRTLAGLDHPGLVKVYDVGRHGEHPFVVLELLEGPALSVLIGPGRTIPPDDLARSGARLADALAYIHSRGLVHRDVTPANVLWGRGGDPRLVDFGVVRLLDNPRVTATSVVVGTLAYMAPEQMQGRDVTPAADVYALGLVLLEALTGRREFAGTATEIAGARLVRDPDTTTLVPPAWHSLLGRMCRRDPAERPCARDVMLHLEVLGGVDEQPAEPATPDASSVAVTAVTPAVTQTQLMPVPAALWDDGTGSHARAGPPWPRGRGWLVGVVAALVAGVLLVAAAASGPSDGDPADPGTTVADPASEATTIVTTTSTVAPPAAEPVAPARAEPPNHHGKKGTAKGR